METKHENELKAWEELKKTRTYHADFGRTLLAKAFALLQSIPIVENRVEITQETIVLLRKFSEVNIDKAVKIEAEAREALLELEKNKPEIL